MNELKVHACTAAHIHRYIHQYSVRDKCNERISDEWWSEWVLQYVFRFSIHANIFCVPSFILPSLESPSSKAFDQDWTHTHTHTHTHILSQNKPDIGCYYVSGYPYIKAIFPRLFFPSLSKYINILYITVQAYWGGRQAYWGGRSWFFLSSLYLSSNFWSIYMQIRSKWFLQLK